MVNIVEHLLNISLKSLRAFQWELEQSARKHHPLYQIFFKAQTGDNESIDLAMRINDEFSRRSDEFYASSGVSGIMLQRSVFFKEENELLKLMKQIFDFIHDIETIFRQVTNNQIINAEDLNKIIELLLPNGKAELSRLFKCSELLYDCVQLLPSRMLDAKYLFALCTINGATYNKLKLLQLGNTNNSVTERPAKEAIYQAIANRILAHNEHYVCDFFMRIDSQQRTQLFEETPQLILQIKELKAKEQDLMKQLQVFAYSIRNIVLSFKKSQPALYQACLVSPIEDQLHPVPSIVNNAMASAALTDYLKTPSQLSLIIKKYLVVSEAINLCRKPILSSCRLLELSAFFKTHGSILAAQETYSDYFLWVNPITVLIEKMIATPALNLKSQAMLLVPFI